MPGLIPQRPKNGKFDLRPEEMDGLSYYVLSGCTREIAFLKFIRPDFIGSKAVAAVKNAVSQFFASKQAKDYIAAYKETIDELLSGKSTSGSYSSTPVITGNMEEKKARAKAKAMEFAMSLAEHIEEASDPEFVMKMLDKVGILDGDEQVEELPRRYLPVSCLRECAYRMFCEQNTEDMCQYCRYKKFGEENGVHFDKNKMLDVPDGTKIEAQTQ